MFVNLLQFRRKTTVQIYIFFLIRVTILKENYRFPLSNFEIRPSNFCFMLVLTIFQEKKNKATITSMTATKIQCQAKSSISRTSAKINTNTHTNGAEQHKIEFHFFAVSNFCARSATTTKDNEINRRYNNGNYHTEKRQATPSQLPHMWRDHRILSDGSRALDCETIRNALALVPWIWFPSHTLPKLRQHHQA